MKIAARPGRRAHDGVPPRPAPHRGEPVRHHLPRALRLLLAPHRPHDLRRATASSCSTSRRSRPTAARCASTPATRRTTRKPVERRGRRPAAPARRRSGSPTSSATRAFAAQVEETKRGILEFLIEARSARASAIAGYGAPGKGNTLLNYCGIRTDFLDYTVDRNPYKQGMFLPGHPHPDPRARARSSGSRPDYVLILPWNFKDEIMAQMAGIRDWGGRFVVPIPTPTDRAVSAHRCWTDHRGVERLDGRADLGRRRRGDARLHGRPVPVLPQHHRRRAARDARSASARSCPLQLHRGADRHAGLRLDGAEGVERPRRLGRRRPRASGSSTSGVEPARRELQRAGADAAQPRRAAPAPAHAARPPRPGCRTGRRYYARELGLLPQPGRRSTALPDGEYEAVIDATLDDGSLTYGECVLPGASDDEILISSHVCHPSLANDNLSGVAVADVPGPARWPTADAPLHVPVPVRPGHHRRHHLAGAQRGRCSAGSGPGSCSPASATPGPLVYKRSRRGDAEIDRAAAHVLRSAAAPTRSSTSRPTATTSASSARPGFDLPVGAITPLGPRPVRASPHLGRRPRFDRAGRSGRLARRLPADPRHPRARRHAGRASTPRASRSSAGAACTAPSAAGPSRTQLESALLWVMNLADGQHTMLDVAERAGLPFAVVRRGGAGAARRRTCCGAKRPTDGPARERSGR